jgi:hypothetical protein
MDSLGIRRIVTEIEYRRARRKHWAKERPRLVVVHGYHQPGTVCLAGESLEGAQLSFPDRDIPVHLSLPGLMVCDCLARHHSTPLSVARMEHILARDPFYRRLGANGFERAKEIPKFTRVALRVYIARLRAQIAIALKKGGSTLSAEEALKAETTDSNVVVHCINLPVEVLHRSIRLM